MIFQKHAFMENMYMDVLIMTKAETAYNMASKDVTTLF